MNKNRKGFTIVELVIVIAIIAILAAVLIPTFASLIQKANISKDTQVIRNLNTAIATATEKPETMRDALKIAAEAGYLVDKINAAANGNDILWDSENKVFCYMNAETGAVAYIPETKVENANVAKYQFWKIYNDKMPALSEQRYSIYLTANATAAEEVTVKVGFDAGDNTKVKTVNYNNDGAEQKVDIYTTGVMTLTVDAEKDTIYHYGEAGNVEIVKCAPASYHVYGKVIGTISVKQGHVSVEAGATVSAVIVPEDATGQVAITNKGTVNIVNTEKANSSANVAVNNKGTIEVSVGTATMSGNKANNEYTASKKLTADTHEITEGGYYDCSGIVISTATSFSSGSYGLYINTTEKVVINGLTISGNFYGILVSNKDETARDVTILNSTITGTRAICTKGADSVTVANCVFSYYGLANYDREVKNEKQGFLINNSGAKVTINNTTIQGFAYSVYPSVASNIELTLTNSVLKGRAGLAMYGTNGLKANIDSCIIHGINGFGGTNEEFANITTQNVRDGNKNIELSIKDCAFTVYRLPATANNDQRAVAVDYDNTTVSFSGNNTFYGEITYASDMEEEALKAKAYDVVIDTRKNASRGNDGFSSVEMIISSNSGKSVKVKVK